MATFNNNDKALKDKKGKQRKKVLGNVTKTATTQASGAGTSNAGLDSPGDVFGGEGKQGAFKSPFVAPGGEDIPRRALTQALLPEDVPRTATQDTGGGFRGRGVGTPGPSGAEQIRDVGARGLVAGLESIGVPEATRNISALGPSFTRIGEAQEEFGIPGALGATAREVQRGVTSAGERLEELNVAAGQQIEQFGEAFRGGFGGGEEGPTATFIEGTQPTAQEQIAGEAGPAFSTVGPGDRKLPNETNTQFYNRIAGEVAKSREGIASLQQRFTGGPARSGYTERVAREDQARRDRRLERDIATGRISPRAAATLTKRRGQDLTAQLGREQISAADKRAGITAETARLGQASTRAVAGAKLGQASQQFFAKHKLDLGKFQQTGQIDANKLLTNLGKARENLGESGYFDQLNTAFDLDPSLQGRVDPSIIQSLIDYKESKK